MQKNVKLEHAILDIFEAGILLVLCLIVLPQGFP